MVNVIKMYLKEEFGITPELVCDGDFFLPVCGEINFDSAYDCLVKFFSETGCESYEVTTSDGFGSDEFVNFLVRRENYAFRMTLISDGNSVIFAVV